MNEKQSKKTETIVEKTTAEQIWEEIKDQQIQMFSLPNQIVNQYCDPMFVEPNRLYLTIKSGATSVLPALEASLGNKFTFDLSYKYVIVARNTPKF